METNGFTLQGQNDEFWPRILGFDPPSWLFASPLQALVVSEGLFRQAWEEVGHGFKNSSNSLDKNTQGCNVITRGYHLVPALSCHCLSGRSCRRGQNLATEA